MAKNNNCKPHIARRTGALGCTVPHIYDLPCPRSDWVSVLASLPLVPHLLVEGIAESDMTDVASEDGQGVNERGLATVPMPNGAMGEKREHDVAQASYYNPCQLDSEDGQDTQ